MGGNGSSCCKSSPSTGELPPQPSPIKEGALYISSLNEVLNISRDKLDSSFMPKGRAFGKNSLILPMGGNFEPRLYVRFFLIYSFYISKYGEKDSSRIKEYQDIFYKLTAKTHPEESKELDAFKS
jgi:hypothetical protein